MVSINSFGIKLPVTLLLLVMTFEMYANTAPGNVRAVALVGALLLIEGYVLGIDSTIVKRIVRMKPLNRIVNGLFYLWLGVGYLIIMSLTGGFVFIQFAFMIFVCIVGVSMLVYHVRKGGRVREKGFNPTVALSTLLVTIGSDIGVIALFFSIFVIINYVVGFLFFILGYLLRATGGWVGRRLGMVKEELFPGEEPSSK